MAPQTQLSSAPYEQSNPSDNLFAQRVQDPAKTSKKEFATRSKTGSEIFAHQGPLKKKKKKEESVGCFYVGLRFFGLFCTDLLRVILTPPARYQHPHDQGALKKKSDGPLRIFD
jgi:hypothetical protein